MKTIISILAMSLVALMCFQSRPTSVEVLPGQSVSIGCGVNVDVETFDTACYDDGSERQIYATGKAGGRAFKISVNHLFLIDGTQISIGNFGVLLVSRCDWIAWTALFVALTLAGMVWYEAGWRCFLVATAIGKIDCSLYSRLLWR